MERGSNRLSLSAVLSERDALRHTPAGIPILSFRVAHISRQEEAGVEREVQFETGCVAVQEQARLIAHAPLGTTVSLTGFLAAKSRSSKQLILHVQNIEFVS